MSRFSHQVLPGGLSDQDRDRITELAEQGLGAGPIARLILKNPSTVWWFMTCNGLRKPAQHSTMPTDRPNAAGKKGFSPEEDRFITELREAGTARGEIARLVSERFGHPRSWSTIRNRLIMLACAEEAA